MFMDTYIPSRVHNKDRREKSIDRIVYCVYVRKITEKYHEFQFRNSHGVIFQNLAPIFCPLFRPLVIFAKGHQFELYTKNRVHGLIHVWLDVEICL